MDPKSAACISFLSLIAFWASGRCREKATDEPAEGRVRGSIRKAMEEIHVEVMEGKRSLADASRLLTLVSLRDETVRIAYEVQGKPLDLRSADFLLQWTEDLTQQTDARNSSLAEEALERVRKEHADLMRAAY
ncbi:MAG: hypothetical protein K2X38_09335 [Gemmataceae bacterium]|nr:hypothetical protein [Gemmataceae bacterium]